tara:strand:- start:109 stop:684 length:576 start_codon:yes stop_codon:yes gene_type:complete
MEGTKEMRVIDVGCGPGVWVEKLNQVDDISAIGIDIDRSIPDKPWLHRVDVLSDKFDKYVDYDIALCFEVVEHLDPETSELFIKKLCRTAPEIYFSAAVPGQVGLGHINCQPKEYWENIFNKNNYIYDPETTEEFREFIMSKVWIDWMEKNVMVFKNYGSMYYDTIVEEEQDAAVHMAAYFEDKNGKSKRK